MFQDWESESDTENSEQHNGLHRSADSFVEYMDIDVEPSGNQMNVGLSFLVKNTLLFY